MPRIASLGLRLGAVAAGGTIMLAGMVFALRGESDDSASGAAALEIPALVSQQPTAAPAEAATASTPAVSPSPETADAAPTEGVPSATAVLLQPGAKPASQPAATFTTASNQPITDLPKYKDTYVFELARGVRLPSGRTFEDCVSMPPTGQRWPNPVHLYYEGKGKWLVETHLSEIQVEFTEATGTFRVQHFAPENPECLKAP